MNRNTILRSILALAAVIFLYTAVHADSDVTEETLKTAGMDDKISYAIGFDISENLKGNFNINTDLFLQGMKDSMGQTPKMTDDQIRETLTAFQEMAQQKQMEALGKKADENKIKGKAFLEENKTKEGVVELASGLQYKIITEGDGASPKPEDKVKCHYKGTLIDGTVFDSSYQRNQPAVFPVNGVIQGWTEALQLMKVGSKWMLYIPSDIAYGDRGAGNVIEPGSTLVFEVSLLSIEE